MEYQRNDEAWAEITNRNVSNALADLTSASITVIAPDETVVVNAEAMTKRSTGIYDHYYSIPSDAQIGWYKALVTCIDGSHSWVVPGGFRVIED